jgi:hypothetical protein
MEPGDSHRQPKTHCPQGHEYTEENTYINTRGSKTCRECRRASNKRYEKKRGPRGPRKKYPVKKRVLGQPGVEECIFPGCDRPTRGANDELCQGHYTQHWRGFELKPLRNRLTPRKTDMGAAQVVDEMGRKLCSQCLELKDISEFHGNNKTKTGLDYCCKPCRRELYDTPERTRDTGLRRKYGITSAQYDELLAAQGGKCSICRRFPPEGTMLHVDHDHACCPNYQKTCGNCIRALLCGNCNWAIGLFEDDPARIARALDHVSPKDKPHEPRTGA